MSTVVDTANLEMLKEVIGDDLKEILQSFIDVAPDMVYQIEAALRNQDASSLQLHAHTLKGSSANVVAIHLPNLTLVLEKAGKAGNTTTELENDFNAVKS